MSSAEVNKAKMGLKEVTLSLALNKTKKKKKALGLDLLLGCVQCSIRLTTPA